MSRSLDDLARRLATPMPRRRALRVIAGAVAGVWLGSSVPVARARHECYGKVDTGEWKFCTEETDWCFPTCCPKTFACSVFTDLTTGALHPCPATSCCDPCDPDASQPIAGGRCGPGPVAASCGCPEERKCGKSCCTDEEYCASKPLSKCCTKGAGWCVTLAEPGTAGGTGAGSCCMAPTPKCCANDKRHACCQASDGCCAGRCCPHDKHCDPATGTCSCPKATKTCGRHCCNTRTEKCCGTSHCCNKHEVCCGAAGCCNTKAGEHCSNGKCCPRGEVNCGGKGTCCKQIDCCGSTCCEGDKLCANGTCCSPERGIGSGKSARCCPAGTVRTGVACCPKSNPACCSPDDLAVVCAAGLTCVSGTCQRL